jgi:hypothetical protein
MKLLAKFGLNFVQCAIGFWESHMKSFAGAAAFISFFLLMSPANAACGDSLDFIGDCIFGKPATGQGMPQDERMLSIRHSSNVKLNKTDLYAVTITCHVNDLLHNVDWNPFVEANLVTSHMIALTTTRLAQADLPTPDKSRATITAFSVSGDNKSRKVFLNKECRSTFLVSGRETLFLAATANQTTTNTPGPVTRLIYEAIQVAIPILPLIKGTALASTIVTNAGKTQDPLKAVITELDKGRTFTKSDNLYVGNNVIRTPYSRVVVNISKIKSLLDKGNDDFLTIFEDATDAAETSLSLNTASNLSVKCGEFAAGLKGRNFSPSDIAYALVLVTQAANLSRDSTLDCMSSRYALPALEDRISPAWNRYSGRNYTKADAISKFADGGGVVVAQPKFEKWAVQLRVLVAVMGGYLQSGGRQTIDWSKFYTDPVHIINTTAFYSTEFGDSDPPLTTLLATLVEKNFKRAGCLTSDTDALAAFSLFRSNDSAKNQFDPKDTIAVRVWYNEKQRISRLMIDYDPDVLEKALNGKKLRTCGEDLLVSGAGGSVAAKALGRNTASLR